MCYIIIKQFAALFEIWYCFHKKKLRGTILATNIAYDIKKLETDISDMWKDLESKMAQGMYNVIAAIDIFLMH